MVGKCSPVRRRRRPRSNLSEHNQDHEPQQKGVGPVPTLSSSSVGLSRSEAAPLLDWTEQSPLQLANTQSPALSAHDFSHDSMLLQGPLTDELEAFISSCIDQSESLFGLDDLETDHSQIEALGGDTSTAVQQSSPQYSPKERHQDQSSIPEKCAESLQGCLRMITRLEEQLHHRVPSVDEVMQISKSCAEELAISIQLDWFCRGTAGPMLVLTAAEQITLLFESSVLAFMPEIDRVSHGEKEATSAGNTSCQSKSPPARYPSLTLGNFQADPEEASLIWQHVFSGELRRFLQLIEIIRDKPVLSTDRRSQSTSRQRLCDGLKQRIKSMLMSIRDLRGRDDVDMY